MFFQNVCFAAVIEKKIYCTNEFFPVYVKFTSMYNKGDRKSLHAVDKRLTYSPFLVDYGYNTYLVTVVACIKFVSFYNTITDKLHLYHLPYLY